MIAVAQSKMSKGSYMKNTAHLKTMLETIPESALSFEEDTFEKDLDIVLKSYKGQEEQVEKMTSLNCDQCGFRDASNRCLCTHVIFVHDPKFYNCDMCPMKTRTQQAMYYYIYMEHNPPGPERKARSSPKEEGRN